MYKITQREVYSFMKTLSSLRLCILRNNITCT